MKKIKLKTRLKILNISVVIVIVLLVSLILALTRGRISQIITGRDSIQKYTDGQSIDSTLSYSELLEAVEYLQEQVNIINTTKTKVLYPYHPAKSSYSGEVSVTEDPTIAEITSGYNTIYTNNRWYFNNPYPGHKVFCYTQVYYNGAWGKPGFIYADGGYGVDANQYESSTENYVVIQSGNRAVLTLGVNTGTPLNNTANISSLPVRVIVICLD